LIFSDHLGEPESQGVEAAFDAGLWSALDQAGLARLSVPESAGGSGAGLAEAGALLTLAGQYAAPVPLAETDLLAGWLLSSAGVAVAEGPLTAVAADLAVAPRRDGWQVRGTLERVPWARCAEAIAVLTPGPGGSVVLALGPAQYRTEPGRNLAGEPRDRVIVDGLLPTESGTTAPEGARAELRRRGALARALQIAGAARQALSLTVTYATEREQFGRPIGRFQAVQQEVAVLAAEVAAAGAAAEAALRVVGTDGFAGTPAALAVAMAKARTSAAATVIARIAHQVHGALGFTAEHRLRLSTTRLWSWRDEYGNEADWHTVIGTAAADAGANGLWPMLTSVP
jgi:acyl-CoA dehydrogenase